MRAKMANLNGSFGKKNDKMSYESRTRIKKKINGSKRQS